MLAIFDVEGVLFDAEYLPLLAEKVNKEKEIWNITKKGISGKIDWEYGLRSRIELLRGLSYDTCQEVANSLPIMDGAKLVCKTLKNAGWKLMAVTGGFTIMTNRLKQELNLDYVFSNELIFTNGLLDEVKINVDSNKAKCAKIKVDEWRQQKKDIVIVVDGANDLTLFDLCGFGIAFCAQDSVKCMADAYLEEKDLTQIINLINSHYSLDLAVEKA
ncbi:MAG: phosphoserine phosphatase SerB [Thaumarchaeota archaeon]|nr:phosphoserine phosphatase SerB [Nitrososphaerota archaeon]